MNPAEITRKVQQLDRDVDAIYGMLGDIQGTLKRHGRRFDAMDNRFDAMDARFDTVDARFDAMDTKVGAIDAKLDRVLDRLP